MPQIEIQGMTFECTAPESSQGFWLKVGCGAAGVHGPASAHDVRQLGRFFWRQADQLEPRPEPQLLEEIIQAGVRQLAKRDHPDAGGNDAAMAKLNEAAEWIKNEVRRFL